MRKMLRCCRICRTLGAIYPTASGAVRRLALEVHLDQSGKGGLFAQIAARTFRAYVRMSATVVIAVVVRICLDCIGIILTRQEPTAVNFWFAHCSGGIDGSPAQCVAMGISIFVASLIGCSAFAWGARDWITDPARNPRARRHSFGIVVEAATWVPISVVVGKTNALVEVFMDVSEDDLVQALVASAIAAAITLTCTLLTHVAMTRCHRVAGNGRPKAGIVSFGKFVLLATLYCLGWAVGWSNWKLVLSMMDVLEPGASVHNTVLAGAVISFFLVFAVCFYLRFGPEPIIPDPELQQWLYCHGYSGSIRRSLISYAVYSCTVFVVMACSDSTYGIFHVFQERIYSLKDQPESSAAMHAKLLLVLALGFVACVVTALAALCSAAITRTMEVDEMSSARLSRSGRENQLMYAASRSDVELVATTSSGSIPEDECGGGGDAAAGCPRNGDGGGGSSGSGDAPQRSLSETKCCYSALEKDMNFDLEAFAAAIAGDGNEVARDISRTLCASVLVYDVLGLVVCFQWGTFAFRSYGILFGNVAGMHNALYVLSCLLYAIGVVFMLTRFVWRYFPSNEELKWHKPHVDQASWFLMTDGTVSEPFLEDDDDYSEDMTFFVRAPPSVPPWQPPDAVTSPELSSHGAI